MNLKTIYECHQPSMHIAHDHWTCKPVAYGRLLVGKSKPVLMSQSISVSYFPCEDTGLALLHTKHVLTSEL